MTAHYIDIAPMPPFPNHGRWSLIHYTGTAGVPPAGAQWFEKVFSENGWGDSWRNGVFSFHHYHSTAHEILGCYSGKAVVQFGGPEGPVVELNTGDAVLIPAGIGHCLRSSKGDFRVVGSYPDGTSPDLIMGDPREFETALIRSLAAPLPAMDPLYGPSGPMRERWKEK